MKKFNLFLKIALTTSILALFSVTSSAQFSGGTGASDDPYQIGTRADLIALVDSCYKSTNAAAFPAANYVLTANIEMQQGDTLHPIGTEKYPASFSGTFDGMNYVVKNAYIIPDTAAAAGSVNGGCAFFGRVTGTIQNMGFINCEVYNMNGTAKANMVAMIAGQVNGTALIKNCFVLGGVVTGSGAWGTAGIVAGSWGGGTISNCFYEGTIKAGYGVRTMFSMPQASAKNGPDYVNIDSCISYAKFLGGGADAVSAPQGAQTDNYYLSTVGSADANATELAPIAMANQASFSLDFSNTWVMSAAGGYPVLKSFAGNPAIDYAMLMAPAEPVADAGADMYVMANSTITLDGSASVANTPSNELTYAWTAVGNAPALDDATAMMPTFTSTNVTDNKTPDILQYALTVNNGQYSSKPDTVVVRVEEYVEVTGTDLQRSFWEFIDASSDAANGGGAAGRVALIDDDVTTNWSSEWATDNFPDPADQAFPIYITLDMKRTATINNLIYTPRQDQWGPGGTIKDYDVYYTTDTANWGTAQSGTFSFKDPEYANGAGTRASNLEDYRGKRYITFPANTSARFIKLVIKTQMTPDQNPHLCFSELNVTGEYTDAEFGAMTVDAGDNQTVSSGEEVMLDATASTTDERLTLKYMWTTPDFITLDDATSATPKFTTDSVGTHKIYVTVNDGFNEAMQDSVLVTVEALKAYTVKFHVTNDGQAVEMATVYLDADQATTSADGMASFMDVIEGAHTYSVSAITVPGGIINTTPIEISGDTTVNIAFGSASIADHIAQSVKAYPSPVNDVLSIESAAIIENVTIFNLAGKEVFKHTVNSPEYQVSVAGFESGIYFTRISGEGYSKTLRVVVE